MNFHVFFYDSAYITQTLVLKEYSSDNVEDLMCAYTLNVTSDYLCVY